MPTTTELKQFCPQIGRLDWIGLSPEKRGEIRSVELAKVRTEQGLVGDHHSGGPGGARQITLIQAEHLPVIGALAGLVRIEPEQMRRNLVVSGINLLALKDRRFRIGTVILEGTGGCAPCSRMEETLGPGGFQAARGHGGITARVLTGGTLRVGDQVRDLPPPH